MKTLRSSTFVLVPVLLAGLAGAAVPASAATTAPAVSRVFVVGEAAGGLVQATGTGFQPGVAVDVTFVDADGPVELATTTADASGTVHLPAGTYTPTTATPGPYHLTMTQAGGVSASSNTDSIIAPEVVGYPDQVLPGWEADPLGYNRLELEGLADAPGVDRSVTLDGHPLPVVWYGDDRAFTQEGLGVGVPADTTVGPHQMTFTQTGPTPFTFTWTTQVGSPTVHVYGAPVPSTGDLTITVDSPVLGDAFDVTVVGAAGDVHAGLGVGDASQGRSTHVDGLSGGTATVTATSRRNGATASTTVEVEYTSVTAPSGLAPGQKIFDIGGEEYLAMQGDGNLVLYDGSHAHWSSKTFGHPGAELVVQPDGNTVVRAPNGAALWSSGTAGIGPGARLGFDHFRDLALFAASGRETWSSLTHGPYLALTLNADQYLFKEQAFRRALDYTGNMWLKVQSDGNVVVGNSVKGVVWSTRTQGHPNAYLLLQNDGNLVVRAPDGTVLWSNGVHAHGARIAAQADGNVVEYQGSRTLWSTHTALPVQWP